jgi:Caspase domain
MRARSIVLFALALLCGLFVADGDAFAAKRVALVIGNSAYQNVPALPNPSNDAAAVADMFKNAGFDAVELRRDVGSLDMRRALRDFYDKAASADIAVVYYAGHGIEVDGTNYMVPVDAVLKRDRDVDDEAVSLDRILDSVDQAKQLRLIILDACRDNPFAKTMIRTTAARALTTRGLIAAEPTTTNTLIAYAAKGGSTADDGNSGHSPFTTALLAHLTTPGLDVRQAFGEVRDDVLKATDNKQEPYVYGSLGGGQMALVTAPATAAATPAPTPTPAAADATLQMRQDYEFAERVGTKQAWTYFLQHYPDGFYANLAKAQLDKLSVAAAPATPAVPATPAQPQPSTQVAALPTDTSRTTINPADLARSVQTELKRVGCYSGTVDGDWGSGSRSALDQFNKYAPAKLDTKLASSDALDALHAKTTRVCPLVCDHGYQASGDSCTKVVCKDGYQVGDDNTCEKIPPKRSTPTASRQQQQQQSQPAPTRQSSRGGYGGAAAAGGGGAQIICDDHGCIPKPKGCIVVAVPTGQSCQY